MLFFFKGSMAFISHSPCACVCLFPFMVVTFIHACALSPEVLTEPADTDAIVRVFMFLGLALLAPQVILPCG